jgi:23S rRNA (guanosine2251-2'-O)-methyltransferase
MKRVVPGIHSVREALVTRPEAVAELWIKDDKLHDDLQELFDLAQKSKIKIIKSSVRKLDHEVTSHQGVIAFLRDSPSWPDAKRLKESKQALILVLDSLEDPHNVGSLMRSAWNLGVTGVIFNKDHAAGGSPSAQKVATGAFEHVPVLEVANIQAELKTLKEFGFWVYGLEEKAPKKIGDTEFAPKTILIVGSEEKGLRKTSRDVCDELVSIPSTGNSSSLNASVAGAVAMYEVKRQISLLQK